MTRSGDEQGSRREPDATAGRRGEDRRDSEPGSGAEKERRIADAERRAGELLDERRRLLERAAALEDEVAALEGAVRAREDFLAVVGHELRTPLTPLLTSLELLREEPLSERARRCVEIIARNLDAQSRLIDDLADLSRIQQRRFELALAPVALAPLVERSVDRVRGLAGGRSLSLAIEPSAEVTVQADAVRLEQAVVNVVASAIRSSSSTGSVTVRAARAGERVRVEIDDERLPPTPEEVRALLDPFGPPPPGAPRRALGLDLPVAKGVFEAHGGTLAIEAAPGGTTRSIIELPATPAAGSRSPLAAGPLRILLVDDHEDSLTLTRMMLERRGYTITTAGSVREALACAESATFDVLITDIGLPDDSGLSLLPELAKRGPITGIAVSGFGRDADIARSKAAGYVDHLTKPVSMQRLHDLIQSLFG